MGGGIDQQEGSDDELSTKARCCDDAEDDEETDRTAVPTEQRKGFCFPPETGL